MWNKKFENLNEFLYGKEPNQFIATEIENWNGKNLICFGEGEGRNAVYLAEKGFSVTALDSSEVGLKKAKDFAKENNLEIETILTKIEDFRTSEKFDIAISSFMHIHSGLQKTAFEKIVLSLKVGGVFIGEFFSEEQLNFSSGGPKDIDLLYSEKEVREILSNLNCKIKKCEVEKTTLNEGKGHIGEASVLRIVFVR
ncbi:Tellurite resistance protein TehB [Thiovulum sp. ES]|nr:Tellurite resistance protein TehB [Thiovulum sp. ES]